MGSERFVISDKVKKMLIPGAAVRITYGAGNINNTTAHIRSIVDGDQVVYRVWCRSKRCYYYHVESLYFFELRKDYIKRVKSNV